MDRRNKRIPIRRRVLSAVLLTVLAAMLLSITASVVSMLRIKGEAEEALTKQLERNLKHVVEQKAATTDTKLDHYEKYVEFLTDYIEEMYRGREALVSMGTYIDAPRAKTGEGMYAMQGGLASENLKPEDVMDDIRFFSNIEKVWNPIVRENEGVINTVYVGLKSGFMVSYDRWSTLAAIPEDEYLYYNFKESDWYKQGMEADGIFYTGLYADYQNRGLTITVAKPFSDANGTVQGVNCADFDITGLYADMISMEIEGQALSFAIDADGKLILPDSEGVSLTDVTDLSENEVSKLMGKEGIFEKAGKLFVHVPVDRVGWTLCVSVPKSVALNDVQNMGQMISFSILGILLGAAFIIIIIALVVRRVARTVTYPMELLKEDMELIAEGRLDHTAKVYRNDEVGDITRKLNEMVNRLKNTITELADTRQQAEKMSELANKDALTGIRNKTAYDKEFLNVEWERANGNKEFGFAMIDLNFLKRINDTFGHDKGNIAIKKLCRIVCEIFDHSPVFRIGGDEFVVILKGRDYHHVEKLVEKLRHELETLQMDETLEPWEKVSAAIGYALYDEAVDSSVDNVFRRADSAMYENKRKMKAIRE